MADRQLPSPEVLRQLLRYEPKTGKLFWLPRGPEIVADNRQRNGWNTRFAGKEAFFTVDHGGYLYSTMRLGSQITLRAHRVIWAIVHGEWPAHQIDHINGNRQDNRLQNLRHVSRAENLRNCKVRVDNQTGVIGVSKVGDKFRARIKARGKELPLGMFDRFEDAVSARKRAEQEHGYHANHGAR